MQTMMISHPGMSREFFDKAVGRAMMADLCIMQTSRPGTVAVSSGSSDEIEYLVTRTTCGCKGHEHTGRCYHRALAIAWWDVLSGVELGSARYADDLPAA